MYLSYFLQDAHTMPFNYYHTMIGNFCNYRIIRSWLLCHK